LIIETLVQGTNREVGVAKSNNAAREYGLPTEKRKRATMLFTRKTTINSPQAKYRYLCSLPVDRK
jgi:hypothetical protein